METIKTSFFDRHLHVREENMLKLVLPYSVHQAWGGIIMPNTSSIINNAGRATMYLQEIQKAIPEGNSFVPYLTYYLEDSSSASQVVDGYLRGHWKAVKYYPALGTTNAHAGVTSVHRVLPVLAAMEEHSIPLLIHGELIDDTKDPLIFEKDFIEKILLKEIVPRFPRLKIVLEHITTSISGDLVHSQQHLLWATVTPQHLMYSHRHLFQKGKVADGSFKRGIRANFWCMPILKMDPERNMLLQKVASGSPRFGAGTDSAPHTREKKYQDLGCGGCFTSPFAVEMYTEAFDRAHRLEHLPNFLGVNLLQDVYGIEPSTDKVLTLVKEESEIPYKIENEFGIDLDNLAGGEKLAWRIQGS